MSILSGRSGGCVLDPPTDPIVTAVAEQPYDKSFGDHIAEVYPPFQFTRHTTRLVEIGQQLADYIITRLLLEMPPRHFKSTIFSRFLPSYFVRRYPAKTWGQGAHSQTLAAEFGEAARDYYLASGGTLHPGSTSKDRWKTANGIGGLWAAGVGKGTGLPADFLSVDDPIKGREEADSAAYRRRLCNWYSTVLNTREEPGGIKLITHTRWSEADLIGWLLTQVEELEKEGHADAAEPWHVISMPLIAEPILKPLPKIVTREPDDREPGQALDPTRYDEEWARKKKLNTPTKDWEALYQQRPSQGEGSIFTGTMFRYYGTQERPGEPGDVILPQRFIRVLCSVDATFKDSADSDMVAMGIWGETQEGLFRIGHVNQRMAFTETLETVRQLWTVQRFGYLLIEDKANGPAIIDTLKREAAGFSVYAVNPMGGKVARANAATVVFNQGRVFLPRHAPWLSEYTGQLLKFPSGTFDDLVDETTQVVNFCAGSGPMRVSQVTHGRSAGGPPPFDPFDDGRRAARVARERRGTF